MKAFTLFLVSLVSLATLIYFSTTTTDIAQARAPSVQRIAFVSDRDGNREIYVMDADGKNIRRLTNHPADDLGPSWSPDGKKIAFISNRAWPSWDIHLMNPDGTAVHRLDLGDVFPEGLTWSPDSKRITFLSRPRDEIYIVDANGTNLRKIVSRHQKPNQVRDLQVWEFARKFPPVWSPNGKWIAFTVWFLGILGEGEEMELFVVDVDTGSNYRRLTNNLDAVKLPPWEREGKLIGVQSPFWLDDEWIVTLGDFIWEINAKSGEAVKGAELLKWFPRTGVAWSPDGWQLALEYRRDIYLADMRNGDLRNLTATMGSGIEESPTWFDPNFPISVFPAGKRMTTWGQIKLFK